MGEPAYLSPGAALDYWATVTPDKPALADPRRTLSYGDLREVVDRTGRSLEATRRRHGDPAFLPVVVDETVDSAVLVLSCLLAGVPFFPLDAGASPEYAASLLERVGSPGVVAVPDTVTDPPLDPGLERVTGSEPASAATRPADDEAPAMVVFTSGSTGRSKGVVIPWGAWRVRWRAWPELLPADRHGTRAVMTSPLDAGWAISQLTAVTHGVGTFIMDTSRMSALDLVRTAAEFEATEVRPPAQIVRVLSQVSNAHEVQAPSVRLVFAGIEAARYEWLAGLRRFFPGLETFRYSMGSTECWMTMNNTFSIDDAPPEGPIPIGVPFQPHTVRIDPVEGFDGAAGEVGEVLVTERVASSYLGDPVQTAERFVRDDEGRLWWRSGDLVTRTPEGLYQHVGRRDDLVRVRGKLASPSEVRIALERVPGIRAAVVLPQREGDVTRLIAHVEVGDDVDLTLDGVRSALSASLPPHMIPAAIIRHDAIPLSERGKFDRGALAAAPVVPW